MSKRRLPIGIQTFRKIREEDCYYVDKTAYIRRLLDEGTHYFLSRPRRFGKSLFLDTLKEVVRGQRAAVRRAAHPRPLGLVGALSGPTPQLRQRQLQRTRLLRGHAHGATRRGRTPGGDCLRVRHGTRPFCLSTRGPTRPSRAAGRRANRRIRQADFGCAGVAGSSPR